MSISAMRRQPRLAVDCIVRLGETIVLVRRRNKPTGWALPGGFVDEGESLESAVRREVREETGLELARVSQFHAYSNPNRDPRGHCVSMVFTADGIGEPRAGDDATALAVLPLEDIPLQELAFDHADIIRDYTTKRYGRD